jgi:hypothetical protein
VAVDSGSTDGTLEVIRRYPHVFVDYSEEPFGYGASLNAGVSASSGEYVVALSSHCIPFDNRWLERLVGALDADDELAGASGPILFEKVASPPQERTERIGLEEFYRRPNRGLQNPNSIIRRKLWEEHPFSGELERCEDQEWAHYFMKQGYSTAVVHGARVLYRIPYGPAGFARKTMRDFLTLNELFGYSQGLSPAGTLKEGARLAGAAVLRRRSPRTSALLLASLAGRAAADGRLRYGRLREHLEKTPGNDAAIVAGILARKAKRGAQLVRRNSVAGKATELVGMQGKQRFFLVGEMRSGTSWLARTLDSHPEVYCKGEGSFFGRGQEVEEIPVYKGPTPSLHNAIARAGAIKTWHSFPWNAWAHGDPDEDVKQLVRLAVDYYLARESAGSGKRIVGDKSPAHTDHVDELHDFYPEAKVIHIFRDGRDVAVSLMHHFWRLSRDRGGFFDLDPEELQKRDAYTADPEAFLAVGNSIFTEERLAQMAARWSRRVLKAEGDGEGRFGDNFHGLRYEELLERPEEKLAEVLRLLGARADGEVVRRCVERNSFEKLARRSAGSEDSASFFRKGVAGDWRGVFTARDREVYEQIAGEALKKMGYPLD